MAFEWAKRRDGWNKKLKLVGLGSVGGNAPANETLTSLDVTINIIKLLTNEGALSEQDLPTECTVTKSGDGPGNAYILPWKATSAVVTQLGGKHEIFVTSQLNGCAVFVGGDATSPIVIHANAQPEYASQGMPEAFDKIPAFDAEVRLPRWDSFYGAVAQQMATTGHLPTVNVGTLLPGQYMKSGDAAVFGVRDGGNWKFYYNSNKSNTQFWPAA